MLQCSFLSGLKRGQNQCAATDFPVHTRMSPPVNHPSESILERLAGDSDRDRFIKLEPNGRECFIIQPEAQCRPGGKCPAGLRSGIVGSPIRETIRSSGGVTSDTLLSGLSPGLTERCGG